MTVRIAVDLNVRVRGDQTYAGLEDADGPVAVGDPVLAVEPFDRIAADAKVTGIDEEKQLVYLKVDWHSFRDDPEATEDPACE
jgi:hypothetical protein